MRVTLGELLGKIMAKEGAALEHDIAIQRWERQHAAEIAASRARREKALAAFDRQRRAEDEGDPR